MMKMKSSLITTRHQSSRGLINCSSDLGKEEMDLGTNSQSYRYSSSTSSQSRRGMMSVFFLLIFALLGMGSGLRINSQGGYEDVTVSVGNDVPPITCQQLIVNLKAIFNSASEYLQTATKGRAYFQKVNIILPAAWDHRACGNMLPNSYTSASSVRDATFRIGGEHPVFGHNPWTQQSKGCGKQGDFISAGFQYVLQYNDTDTGHFIPERGFVHEWVKYKYGVFEEIGFENDPIYPTAYHGTGKTGKDERKPTSCTNRPLQGNWSGSCNDASGSNCAFVAGRGPGENENITSSLMSHPHLPHVKTFCDSTNHNRQAPTKHNFLCDHKSVSEVIYSHPDFHNMSSLPARSRSSEVEFVIKQLTQPRFILIVEETNKMNLRDVWKYLKLATRKFIKYDLPAGTEIGLMTVSNDVRVLANITKIPSEILAEKLPNYPTLESSGTLSLRKGISQAINMLKWGGQRVGGSVIILISQGTISSLDLEASVHLLKQEEVAIATIEYPSIGDGKISSLSQATNSPHFAIRETGVGTMSHMSTYLSLVNALSQIQTFFTKGIAQKWPTLVHQEEFKGDAPSVVESQFNFDASQIPAEFHVYIPTPIDPKVNKVELTSPAGTKFSDHTSTLHDINILKMGVLIDQPGIWRYRIERLGDSHQSHFVQVVTSTSNAAEEVTARVYSNVDEGARGVNLSQMPLILYAEVKRGPSPVIDAEVEALIVAGMHKWSVKLFDNGNGDPDLTKDDGIYSRYIIPPPSVQSAVLEFTVKVRSSPYKTKYISSDNAVISTTPYRRRNDQVCCGSRLIASDSPLLKTMPYTERVATYSIRVSSVKTSEIYPPNRIGDLRVVDSFDTEVTLGFTAPGDDYDHKTVQLFKVFYRRTFNSEPILKEEVPNQDIPAGSGVNMTIRLPSHGIFYLNIVPVDPHGMKGRPSNTVQVRAEPPPPETNTGSSESQVDIYANSDGGLSSAEIAYIICGVIAFLILLAIIIVLCVYCRRRNSKGMGSTETKISTISDTNKAPIHWSASQLLSEHEKRQSMYAPSSHTSGGTVVSQGGGSYGQNIGHHNNIGHFNGSPGSSTRSFRSISDNARKTSVDYESCSSDPTVRSVKGPTDYETPIESDQENYRTLDSSYHHGIPGYNRMNGIQAHNYNIPRVPVTSTNSSSHMQYNPNIQGSLTSVNSKARRNITMV